MTRGLPPRFARVARATAALCATMLVAAACGGGGSSSPTSPGGTTTPANTTVASVAITGSANSVAIGASVQLSAAAQNSAGTAVSATFGWSSSNNAVATVGAATGLVTGVAIGSATITATAGGISSTRAMTVTAAVPPPASAQVDMPGTSFQPSLVTIAQGGTITWVFTAVNHSVFFGTGSGAQDIAVTTNASVARTFNTKGTFAMNCGVHAGMSGTITVQ